jgi:8-oxo-dGTP pyrophosphatase MutT (NUDIX family)
VSKENGLNRVPVPAPLAARAAALLEGRLTPAVPRDAATVMLLRAAGAVPPSSLQHVEVYMLRRMHTMAFAPGAYVFPGGSVDESDAEGGHGWAGPEAAELGPVLGLPPERAQALIRAAVRETFEESGVLLAGPTADSVVADTSGDDWAADRQALAGRSLSLAGLLVRRGLVLRADLLRPWARWITPEAERRRYDTRFFTAALPAGQLVAGGTGEADQEAWLRPAAAIAAAGDGKLVVLPPTAVTLRELAEFLDVPAILAARRRIIPRQPAVIFSDGQAWLEIPGELFRPASDRGPPGPCERPVQWRWCGPAPEPGSREHRRSTAQAAARGRQQPERAVRITRALNRRQGGECR